VIRSQSRLGNVLSVNEGKRLNSDVFAGKVTNQKVEGFRFRSLTRSSQREGSLERVALPEEGGRNNLGLSLGTVQSGLKKHELADRKENMHGLADTM